MRNSLAIGLSIVGVTLCGTPSVAGGTCSSNKSHAASTCTPASKVVAAAHVEAMDIVETAVAAGQFKTLATALGAADLVDALKGDGPFTVFAPTDEAFAKLPKGTIETLLKPENKALLTSILTYHVVPGRVMANDVVKVDSATTLNGQRVNVSTSGGKVQIDGANVIKTDIAASNGVIHVIDTVIMPETKNIAEVAKAAGSFKTLLTAVEAAGLSETLMGEGPFTVFAPTDEAFAKLPEGTVKSLLEPANRAQLKAILTYHVAPSRVFSDQAIVAGTAASVQGGTLTITSAHGKVRINSATVVKADVDASNGVIHVIDTVLMPQ
ncbi:MAG: fasciclin domain-containing protein [Phycisphaerales bacterium]|nr:fasciclin domain-containing protein [Phycisphaerales bacterium]